MWPDQLPPRARRRYMDVAEVIATAISTGQLEPGARLPSNREIATKLGVSRPTAREGLLALEYAGLVEVRPGSGAYVNESPQGPGALALGALESPAMLIEARAAVEPAIARLCATRLAPGRAEMLGKLVVKAEREVGEDGSPTELVRLGLEFHRQLANSCENSFLASFCTSLVSVHDHPVWMLLNRQAMLTVEARRTQVDEHRRIMKAIVDCDPDAAYDAMKAHLEWVSAAVVTVV
jgi:DNA-binding FadR family transcriptional regulator